MTKGVDNYFGYIEEMMPRRSDPKNGQSTAVFHSPIHFFFQK